MSTGLPGTPATVASHTGERRNAASAATSKPAVERMTGSQAIVRSLEELGVTSVFGLPGGAILPTYDPLLDSTKINHILVRHEQGAGHAAQGYAVSTGEVGVCIATSGPGATNLLTPLADANMDSVPMVAITGQVSSKVIGTDAFQEADIVGMTMPITKHSFMVRDAQEIPRCIATAFHIAATGRPGPVLVDITKDAQQGMMDFSWPPAIDVRGYHPVTRGHSKQIREAAHLIAEAQRPVLYVGGGVTRADASDELAQLAEITGAPVVTTLTSRGAFPDSHPQSLGMPGMHGTVPAVTAMQKSDVLVVLGARFDDRVTGVVDTFAPDAKVVHIDIDPAEISKIRYADVPIVGDVKSVLPELNAILSTELAGSMSDLSPWWSVLEKWRKNFPLGYSSTEDGLGQPQHVIERISEMTGPDAYYVAGVGQHQMWSAQFIKHEKPRHWINSAGLGTMGYSVPAAMGVKVAHPEAVVWAIDGDGCFQMTNQELATCVQNNIPIKVAIINNSSLGMVRQWQTLFYDGRYSNTHLNTGANSARIPDFVKLAEAYGAVGLRCESDDEVDATIEQALAINDRPVVIDFTVSPDAMVWPMVPAGVSNDLIQIAKETSPDFDREEV
ncbi:MULTISPECIES: acetolactate synthase large subunit [unclassified Rothia (in: high G+C Gram-positive bacteria)]|uniref:acetolactate synthase large subunit n=1 Tax=unclassified Rothia (in: high G+C Gram-positive bacteria) TaxID=2689056 RepID=UPI00195F1C09|nr:MULTISPECIES: acetolactate synthase large subunit [unclassified Rothia (in: high G+C Gram-positive bacteria)]MBM7050957.1 acetolactate synthase large subunit [Rothia sp. ZJ1223]QRZ62312.1 acetolactate synthase large subunit [Rothia sp. ZJ932]